MPLSVHGCVRSAIAVMAVVWASSAFGQSVHYPPLPYGPPAGYRHGDPRGCDSYAQQEAYRYAPPGAGALRGAARGAIGGGAFGAIVGGGKGARRGAAVAGTLGAVAAGARAQQARSYAYEYAYDDCIRGFRQ